MVTICKRCGEKFQNRPKVNGVRYGGRKRTVCFQCWPYKPKQHRFSEPGGMPGGLRQNECVVCGATDERKYTKPLCDACKRAFDRYRYRYFCMAYKGWKCADCGLESNRHDDFDLFDFHHREEGKEFEMSKGRNVSGERLRAELDKCDLLCALCHRKRHRRAVPEWFSDEAPKHKYRGEYPADGT